MLTSRGCEQRKNSVLKVKHSILQIRVQTVAPHTLRCLVHALLLRLTFSFYSNASRRAGTSTSTSTGTSRTGRGIAPSLIKESLYPEACLLADDVSVIRRGNEADGLCGAGVKVASGVYALLDGISCEGALIVHDDVVRWADGALETCVRLEVEVKVNERSYAAVNDGARARITILVCMIRVRRVKARVMPFPADDDAQRRFVFRVLGIDALERLDNLWQFFVYNFIVLALWWCTN